MRISVTVLSGQWFQFHAECVHANLLVSAGVVTWDSLVDLGNCCAGFEALVGGWRLYVYGARCQ